MPIEHAIVRIVHMLWGLHDLQPWSSADRSSNAVGELRFERANNDAPAQPLTFKPLFVSEPLSIQLHPALIAYPASRPIGSLLQKLGEQPDKPANWKTAAVPHFANPAEVRT